MHAPIQPVKHAKNGLQDYIAISRYARYNPFLRRRETWAEAVHRVRDMHLAHFSDADLQTALDACIADGSVTAEDFARSGLDASNLHQAIITAFRAVEHKQVLPSMRSLQFGGEAVLNKHARIYNCAFTHIDRIEAFREVLWLLLCGCGVGFSVQLRHISQLPALAPRDPAIPVATHTVEDTIEGWADALHILISAHVAGRRVKFDYSRIRPAGSPLRTSGGKAPGPQPLLHALTKIEGILNAAEGRQLRSIEVYDILMWAAKAVLSGGVRRSATICLFSVDDTDMTNAKTGDWFTKNPQRSASNNSAVIVRSTATREQFNALFEAQKQFGEPGFFFVDDPDHGANPCVEIGLNPRIRLDTAAIQRLRELGDSSDLQEGQVLSGVQFCNLTTLSAAAVEEARDFHRLCGLAALIGTLQAAYTRFDYLTPVSRLITEREALLGVSICGILDKPQVFLDPPTLEQGAAVVKAVNAVVARAIGIAPAARTTCVKPEGTASLLLGTGSGIHPHHSVRYFRRVQANVHDPVFQHFKKANPHMVEPSVYDPHERTEVITFPVEGPTFGVYREDLTAVQHLDYVRLVQKHWVQAGRRHEQFTKGLHHNVSCTITVRAGEWDDVADFIWRHRENFTGVALLGDFGDKSYQQAPLESVSGAADIARWNSLVYQDVDYTSLVEDEDITELKQVVACAGGACSIV
jgi:ribonucleoside-diphosphate reductase alpha chain